MGEARRRKLLEASNTHNNVHWRRKERMIRAEAAAEFCAHESPKDGPLMLGNALLRDLAAGEARITRKPSKLLERLRKADTRKAGVRQARAAKRARKAQRAHAKAMGRITAAMAKAAA